MAGFIEGVQRGQTVFFPDRLEDWIGEDALVRVVDLFSRNSTCPALVSCARRTPEQGCPDITLRSSSGFSSMDI